MQRGLLSAFLHKKHIHSCSFYLSGSVNKFLNFCVACFPCCFLKMAIKISHSHFVHIAFVSILVFQTFDRIIFDTLAFLGTRWYVMTVRDTQTVYHQKKFENHWLSPSNVKSHFNDIIDMYSIDLSHSADVVSQEIFMWAVKWKVTNFLDLLASIDKALPQAKQEAYPNVCLFKNFPHHTLHHCFGGEKFFRFKKIEDISSKELWCWEVDWICNDGFAQRSDSELQTSGCEISRRCSTSISISVISLQSENLTFGQYLMLYYFAALHEKLSLSDIAQDLPVFTEIHVPTLTRMFHVLHSFVFYTHPNLNTCVWLLLGISEKKTLKHTWFCAGISPVR